MFLTTALLLGFVSSLHCGGMCGPIALSLPHAQNRQLDISGKLLYNLGRIVTYSMLGALFGLFGKGLALAGIQQAISITLGVILALVSLLSYKPDLMIHRVNFLKKFYSFVVSCFSGYLNNPSLVSMLYIGMLNGLLPCGVVYIALAGSLASGNVMHGMAYMALFGLGTLPVMLFISMAGKMLSFRLRNIFRKAVPAVMLFFAALLIVRGLNLNIPYISPKLDNDITVTRSCH
jgi:sulfite exporter TauE/SafE